MEPRQDHCPDCGRTPETNLDRRHFLKQAAVAAAVAAGSSLPVWAQPATPPASAPTARSAAESALSTLYSSLSDAQRQAVCFDWNHMDQRRGLLRTFISNNWQITRHPVASNFYTRDQQTMIHDIFRGIIHPEWYARVVQQLRDDTGGQPWGSAQSIAIFGTPGSENFEFVMTGRHMTIRADGNTAPHVAFGGPIFYGHAASGFNERVGHPGNVYWEQGRRANQLYRILGGQQQRQALVERLPEESAVGFRPNGPRPGIPVSELSRDQKQELQQVLQMLLSHYRTEDQSEALACLQRQGGLDRCNLAFYREDDLGNDGEWDNWRLEGPAFVWYFRGAPHVHVWVHVADDPSVPLNA